MSLALAVAVVRLMSTSGPAEPDLSPHWVRERITLEVHTGQGAPDGLLEATVRAAAAWNEVGAGPVLEVLEASGPAHELLAVDEVNRVGVLHGAWPYPAQAGAATVAWTSIASQEIFEADIGLNPSFDFGDAATGAFDLQSALTHELGHVLGLPDLVDRGEATMYPAIPAGETLKRDLSEIDVDTLIATYQDVIIEVDAAEVEAPGGQVVVVVEDADPPEREPRGGCSQGGGTAAVTGLALCLLLLRRSTRTASRLRASGGARPVSRRGGVARQ